MSLHQLANHMSARGRGPDSTLVHMSPREVEGLQKLAVANGTSLTINPDTGLPEAFSLQDLLPTLIGGAATYFTGGAITPLMAALGTGAVTALTSKDLGKGLMAGLGAYGGAGIVSGLAGFGAADIGEKAVSSAAADAAAAGYVNGSIGLDPTGMDISGGNAYAAAMQKGVGDRMAGASYSDRFGAGLSKAMSDPMGAANAVGGGSTIAGLTKVAGAISPLLAGETGNTVQTVTKRPSTAQIRPYRYDNMSQTFEEGTPYAAANGGLMRLAHGGAVGYADGGMSLDDAYQSVLGRAPDDAGRAYWSQANVFGDSVDANELASLRASALGGTDTADKAAAQNFGISNAGAGFAATAPVATQATQATLAAPAAQVAPAAPVAETAPLAAAQVFPTELAANTTGNTAANNTGIAALSGAGTAMGSNNALTKTNSAVAIPPLTDQVYDLFINTVDRPPSEADMAYWKTQFGLNNNTIDPNEIADFKSAAAGELSRRQASTSGKNYMLNTDANREALYQSELTRSGEKAGMDFWKSAFGDYIDPEELAGFKEHAARERAARPVVVNPIVQKPDVVTDLTTADTKYIAPGVGGSTSAGQIGGGTTINPNGTITTSPRIPGIPVGGFSGMTDVKKAYTDGGGSLGYTPKFVPTTTAEFDAQYSNTGYQKKMYNYLRGKGPKPTKMTDVDETGKETYREIRRPYKEAVMGVPVNTNTKLNWNKDKGEYERNRDYVHRGRTPLLDAAGKIQYEADGKTVKTGPITYMSTNAAKAALDKTKLTSASGNALAEWAIDNKVQEQSLADIYGIPLETVKSIFENYEASKKPAKNGGLMQLANGGMAYSYGGGVRSEYVNEAGETRVWDRSNGMYRPKTLVKDGKTYTWDTVIDNYKLAGADSGIAGLLDMSGGSNAGDARGPGTGTTTPIENNGFFSSILGRTTQPAARVDYRDMYQSSAIAEQAAKDAANNAATARGIATLGVDPLTGLAPGELAGGSQMTAKADQAVQAGRIADDREARDLANAKAEREFDTALGKQTYSNLTTQYEDALKAAADRAALDAEAQEKGFLSRQDEADAAVIAGDRAIRDAALRDEAGKSTSTAPVVMGFDPSVYSSTSFDTNAKNSQAVAAAADRADRADRAAALSDFDARTDGGNYSGVIGGGVDAGGVPDGGYSGSYDFAHGGMTGYAQGGLGSLGGYSDGGRLLRGPGDGVSDSIPASIGNRQPARLADGEFVVPARIVSELGNGSTEAGARALYKMMARIQANRRKTTGKNSVAVDSKAHKYLPA